MEHQIFNVDKETPVSLSIKTGLFSDLITSNQYFNTECKGLKLGELYVAAHSLQEQNDPTEENPNTYYSGGTLVINTGRGPMFITNKPGPLYKPLVGMGDNVSPSYSNILHLGESGSSGQLSIFGTGNYKANIKYPNTRTSSGGQDSNIELPAYEGLSKIAWIKELADNKGTFDSVGSLNWPVFVNANGELRPCGSVLGSPSTPFALFYTGAIAMLDKPNGAIQGRLYTPSDLRTVLELGNDANQTGHIVLYGDNGGYTTIKNREGKSINTTFYLPPNGAQDTYAIWTAKENNTIEVGSSTWPIYIDANGQARKISDYLGTAETPFGGMYSSKFHLQQNFAAQGDNVKKNVICGSWQVSGTNNASVVGTTRLVLGNAVSRASSTPNKLASCPRSGVIQLHSTYSNKPTNIEPKEKVRNANAHFILPDGTTQPNCKCYGVWGAASTVTDNDITGSGIGNMSHPVYMDENGQLLACETIATTLGGSGLTNPEANRLYFYELETDQNGNSFIKPQQSASNHYIDADILIIGERTAFEVDKVPTGLQVNTNALFNQKLIVANAFSIGGSEIKSALNKSILGQNYLVLRNLDLDTYNILNEKISNTPADVTQEEYDLVNHYKQIWIDPAWTDINTDSFTVKTNYVESNSFNEFSMNQINDIASMSFKSANNDKPHGLIRTVSGIAQPQFGDGSSENDSFYLQNELIYPADPTAETIETEGSYKYLNTLSLNDFSTTLKFTELKYDQNRWNQEKTSEININTDVNITSTGNINLKESSMQIIKGASLSSSWWNGRDYALIRHAHQGKDSFYYPTVSMDGKDSSWEMGTYTENAALYFSCFSNADYENNKKIQSGTQSGTINNSPTGQIKFTKQGDLHTTGSITLNGNISFNGVQKADSSSTNFGLPEHEASNIYFYGNCPTSSSSSTMKSFYQTPISFFSDLNDTNAQNGICVRIGAGGPVILGSGESSNFIAKKITKDYEASWTNLEHTYITSDSQIHLISHCNGSTYAASEANAQELIISQGTICVKEATGEKTATAFGGYGTFTPTMTTGVVKGQVYFKIIE